jgi:hypothetical protein
VADLGDEAGEAQRSGRQQRARGYQVLQIRGGNADGTWRRRRDPWMPPWWERPSGGDFLDSAAALPSTLRTGTEIQI